MTGLVDYFEPTHAPYKMVTEWEKNQIEREINKIKDTRADLKAQLKELQRYDLEDPYEDGTVITWSISSHTTLMKHQAAVREDGKWYVTGELRGLTWQSLVVEHLAAHLNTTVEVIRPPVTEEVVVTV